MNGWENLCLPAEREHDNRCGHIQVIWGCRFRQACGCCRHPV